MSVYTNKKSTIFLCYRKIETETRYTFILVYTITVINSLIATNTKKKLEVGRGRWSLHRV